MRAEKPNETGEGGRGRSALFSTDFSPLSRESFRISLPFLRGLDLDLVIFHALTSSAEAFVGEELYLPENYFSCQHAWALQQAEAWVEEAGSQGVAARFLLNEESLSMADGAAVAEAAEAAGAQLVMIAAPRGPLARLLFGSTALQAFRALKVPVLLYGPQPATLSGALKAAG